MIRVMKYVWKFSIHVPTHTYWWSKTREMRRNTVSLRASTNSVLADKINMGSDTDEIDNHLHIDSCTTRKLIDGRLNHLWSTRWTDTEAVLDRSGAWNYLRDVREQCQLRECTINHHRTIVFDQKKQTKLLVRSIKNERASWPSV